MICSDNTLLYSYFSSNQGLLTNSVWSLSGFSGISAATASPIIQNIAVIGNNF